MHLGHYARGALAAVLKFGACSTECFAHAHVTMHYVLYYMKICICLSLRSCIFKTIVFFRGQVHTDIDRRYQGGSIVQTSPNTR